MGWSEIDLKSKLDYVRSLTNILDLRAKEMSALMADEMGKPKKQGMGEISKCAWLCNYYLENSEKVLCNKYVETEFYESFVTYRPLGVVLA